MDPFVDSGLTVLEFPGVKEQEEVARYVPTYLAGGLGIPKGFDRVQADVSVTCIVPGRTIPINIGPYRRVSDQLKNEHPPDSDEVLPIDDVAVVGCGEGQ